MSDEQQQEAPSAQHVAMLACGCAAMATHSGAHDGLEAGHPSCVVHQCCAVVSGPDLSQRRARCAYFGKMPSKSECNYGGDRRSPCRCEQASAPSLPFFEYLGSDSPTARDKCKCGFAAVAHLPMWTAPLAIDREWYKAGRSVHPASETVHAATEEDARTLIERRADRFRTMTRDNPLYAEVHVYGVTVGDIRRGPSGLKCRAFRPVGAAEFDRFYCGCMGWD